MYLHSPVVPCVGQAKKLYHPWTGPWRVLKPLSEALYKILGTVALKVALCDDEHVTTSTQR